MAADSPCPAAATENARSPSDDLLVAGRRRALVNLIVLVHEFMISLSEKIGYDRVHKIRYTGAMRRVATMM